MKLFAHFLFTLICTSSYAMDLEQWLMPKKSLLSDQELTYNHAMLQKQYLQLGVRAEILKNYLQLTNPSFGLPLEPTAKEEEVACANIHREVQGYKNETTWEPNIVKQTCRQNICIYALRCITLKAVIEQMEQLMPHTGKSTPHGNMPLEEDRN